MAGRTPKPWYRKSKDCWYVHLNGETIRLGKDRGKAFKKFHRVMGGEKDDTGPDDSAMTLNELSKEYLADLERRAGARTVYVARCYLKPVLARCGKLTVKALKKHHIEAAIRKHGRWNPTTENHVKGRVAAVLNWGVDQGLIGTNPVKGIKKPRAKSRGSEALLDATEHERLLDAAPTYLRNVLFTLHQTGARPCEVLAVEARDFYAEEGLWILHAHKTAHVTGKPRIIYLTPAVVELCKDLARNHPTGPLFRRASGKPFPPAYYLPRLVRQLRRKLGLRESITPYGFRHSFATDALANGVPDAQVAELLGHSGTTMLHKHYSHLTARAKALRDALGRVR
jgi:integrase